MMSKCHWVLDWKPLFAQVKELARAAMFRLPMTVADHPLLLQQLDVVDSPACVESYAARKAATKSNTPQASIGPDWSWYSPARQAER